MVVVEAVEVHRLGLDADVVEAAAVAAGRRQREVHIVEVLEKKSENINSVSSMRIFECIPLGLS